MKHLVVTDIDSVQSFIANKLLLYSGIEFCLENADTVFWKWQSTMLALCFSSFQSIFVRCVV